MHTKSCNYFTVERNQLIYKSFEAGSRPYHIDLGFILAAGAGVAAVAGNKGNITDLELNTLAGLPWLSCTYYTHTQRKRGGDPSSISFLLKYI